MALWVRLISLLLLLVALHRPSVAQEIRVDGGSTLYPFLQAVAVEFAERAPSSSFSVTFSGTAGGFVALCRSQAELIGASRSATEEEREACAEAQVALVELPLAVDWITVVVSSSNEWLDCLTVEELRSLWIEGSSLRRWSDLRPEWPDEEIGLYAPGVASGTHQVFDERVLGGAGLRTDFHPSEDDALLAHRVAEQEGAISFFGYASYLRASAELRPVAIDEGSGCREPRPQPRVQLDESALLRPLYLYVNGDSLAAVPALTEFVELLLSPWARDVLVELGYLPQDDERYLLSRERVQEWSSGVKGPKGG